MAKDRSARMRRRVRKAGAGLSALERKVLILASRDGVPNADIACRLGMTPERVEQLLASGLCKLHRALRRRRSWWRVW